MVNGVRDFGMAADTSPPNGAIKRNFASDSEDVYEIRRALPAHAGVRTARAGYWTKPAFTRDFFAGNSGGGRLRTGFGNHFRV
jgi:hypothetical protein